MKQTVNIIAIESSPLISEGLAGILKKCGLPCRLSFAGSFDEAERLHTKNNCHLVIVNPAYISNNSKTFSLTKNRFDPAKWVGLVYAWYDPKILSLFDALITVSDTEDLVAATLNKLLAGDDNPEHSSSLEILTEREIDVLKLLAAGLANKEIADKLNISVNTVITHRKNISQKTGIKSVSGLTIYAVVQKLISIDTISE